MNVTVVVGVDYSEASKEALRLAAQEARWRQAPLIAVSAYEPPIGPVGGFPGSAMHTEGEQRATAEAELRATVDEELDAARTTEDTAARLTHYARAADRILADRPLIYLWHPTWLFAMNAKLTGFAPYPDGLIRPQGMKLP